MTFDDRSGSSERERAALEFMRRGGKLRGFSPAQVRRVERRLLERKRPARRRIWLPRLAVLGLALLAGSAVAAVLDLARVPLLGSLLPSRKSAGPTEPRRVRTPTPRPPVAPGQTDLPSMPPVPANPIPAPEVLPSSLPASPPSPSSGTRSVTSHSPSSPPLRLAARTAEPRERGTDPTSSGGVGAAIGALPAPAASAAPARRTSLEPSPTTAPAPRPWTGPPSPPPGDPVLAESHSFSAAVGRWHMNHDATAALAALDAHQRRFPGGRLSLESTLLRAEILLQLGREREALVLLDGLSLGGLPRGRELQTVRGELRIKHGRCADGRRDLNAVLAQEASDSFGRRAARAISLCPL